MNSNIKPTFLNYIADLEQSDLVGLLTDLVNHEKVTARTLQDILNRNNIEIPKEVVEVIVGHNIKHISVTYCSGYNGCNIEVLETIDGSDLEAYQESDGFQAINDRLINMVVEHAADECSEEGDYYGSIEILCENVIEMIQKVLGDNVEVEFDEDRYSS